MDRRFYYGPEIERIFRKLYLSALFSRPQSISVGGQYCSDKIKVGQRLIRGEANTEISQLVPVAKVDAEFREILAKYRFWPLACNPLGLSGLKLSFGGLGVPYYVNVEFIPLDEVACTAFENIIADTLKEESIDKYMLNYDEYIAANFYFESTALELDMEFRRTPSAVHEDTREILATLKELRLTLDCKAGYLELSK